MFNSLSVQLISYLFTDYLMAIAAPGKTSSNSTYDAGKNYMVPLMIIIALFFVFGFVTNVNDILIPHLKKACELNNFQSAFVQSAFFGAYFFMSLPAGAILRKTGYKKGIVLGLAIAALGAFLFVPSAMTRQYGFFLFALAVLASGITLLQVAANPYISVLGPSDKAASRLSMMGFANSLAGTLSPFIFGSLLLSGIDYTEAQISAMPELEKIAYLNGEAAHVKVPYIILGVVLLAMALTVFLTKMPEIESLQDEQEEQHHNVGKTSVWQFPNLVLGIGAIFTYVAVEVGVASFIIRYIQELNLGLTGEKASIYVSLYWGSAMVGRLIGIPVMARVDTAKALTFNAVVAIALIIISISSSGMASIWCVVACGLCHSIMWPAIFPLAIKGLGNFTKQGSSLLIMAIVGGAVFPPLMGYVTDHQSIQAAYGITLICYVYLVFYGLKGHKTA
jgi:FHS family L-fucose permease-like MFS transporter